MADFLEAAKGLTPSEDMEISELDMTITIRGLTAREINEANKRASKPVPKGKGGAPVTPEVDGEKLTIALLSMSLYGKDGERLIPEGREEEVFDLPHDLVSRLTQRVFRINGLNEPDAEGNS